MWWLTKIFHPSAPAGQSLPTHCRPPLKKFAHIWSKITPVKPLGSELPTLNSLCHTEHGTHATSEAFIIRTNVSLLKGLEGTADAGGGISLEEDY